MPPIRLLVTTCVLAVLSAACTSPRGATVEDQRSFVRKMRDRTLEDLYAANPEFRARLESSAGYAIFTNVNIHLLAVSAGDGYGLAVDRDTGEETFMRVAALGGGPGIAMRDFRTVFLFRTDEAAKRFADSGWEFVVEGNAEAISSDRGSSATALAAVSAGGDQRATASTQASDAATAATGDGVEVYQLTQAGLALNAAMLGTRYVRDEELN
jgi:lipid-binding SYLF domain-containing protein